MEAQPLSKGRVIFLQLIGLSQVVDLAVVKARIQGTQRLGNRLDAFVVSTHGGEHFLCLGIITIDVSLSELVCQRLEFLYFVLDEVNVLRHRGVQQFLILAAEFDRVTGNGEGGLTHVRTTHAGLASGEVVAGLHQGGQLGRRAGSYVFLFCHNLQAVLA